MRDDERTILDAWAQQDRDNATAAAAYKALKKMRKLSSHRLITYRCPQPHGELLLDVLQFPQGVVFHQPTYGLPPAVNEVTSTEAGRKANTVDGDKHWKPQTRFAAGGNVEVTCNHVHQVKLEAADIQADLDAGHKDMEINADGERRPV